MNTTAYKTRQFCLVSTQFTISKISVILNIFETEQLQIGNCVETRQKSSKLGQDKNCLVLLAVVFKAPTSTRQDNTVVYRPSRRCKQPIRLWCPGREFQTTAQKTAKSLAPRTVRVRRTTSYWVSADLRCRLLATDETSTQSSARCGGANP